ncbi:hypothetical protein Glove_173g14 [Diversispora epigaea]|uniref:Uncharacterized protein n=1 Tax=Diversispora epigaea TaxID=1348612 RepID=A0A397IXE3_9GLOM|nr:hypothetical protein Glove_173g14 [Diversispora epigaea]
MYFTWEMISKDRGKDPTQKILFNVWLNKGFERENRTVWNKFIKAATSSKRFNRNNIETQTIELIAS